MKAYVLAFAWVATAACSGAPATLHCGEGTREYAGVCRAPGLSCGPGTFLSGAECVATNGQTSTCGPGTRDNGVECVPETGVDVTCGLGTELKDGACVPVGPGPVITCGPGTSLLGAQCVPVDAGPIITCGPGTSLVGGLCSAPVGSSCGPGTVLVGDACEVKWCPDRCTVTRTRRVSTGASDTNACLGLNCYCLAPHYGPTCDSLPTILTTGASAATGSLAPGAVTYYGFTLDAPSGSATVVESSTVGAIELYLAFQYLPYFPPGSSPDFLSSVVEPGNSTHTAMVSSASGSGAYYLMLKNVGASTAGFTVGYTQP